MLKLKSVSPSIKNLWNKYNSIYLKVIATSLVLGAITITSCHTPRNKRYKGHSLYAVNTYQKPVEKKNLHINDFQKPKAKEDIG
jgi:hypothetical protein